jgi:CheY-like chemotaxis protein
MRILVIDDSQVHLESAKQSLYGHEITVCPSADEALELLQPRYDEAARKRIREEDDRGVYGDRRTDTEAWRKSYYDAMDATRLLYWDAVLSDLLLPAPKYQQGSEGQRHVGKEMPVGWALVLQAALEGAKYIAVVTDTNHHDHPASALMDALGSTSFLNGRGAPKFIINGAKAGFYHSPMRSVEGTTCHFCKGVGKEPEKPECDCRFCQGDGKAQGKDWGRVLKALTE